MKQRIDYINAGLLLILISIVFVFVRQLMNDSYFDKKSWNMVVNAEGLQDKPVQIINAKFSNNTKNGGYQELDEYQRFTIITENKDFYVGFKSFDTENSLYPNTFECEWFSFTDTVNYQLKESIAADKIQNAIKNIKNKGLKDVAFCATLLPKGKVVISVGTENPSDDYNKTYTLIPIDTLQAKAVKSDFTILKNRDSRLENINTLNDFMAVFTKKRKWYFLLALPSNEKVYALFLNDYSDRSINKDAYYNEVTLPKERLLPRDFQLQWQTSEDEFFRTDWQFNANELLDTFKKLEALSPNEAVKIMFVKTNDLNTFQILLSNSKETIALKNAIKSEVTDMN